MYKPLFAVLLLTVSLAAGPLDVAFQKANDLYKAEHYDQALTQYQTLERTAKNGPLFYNIGNCYYKLGNMIEAKYYYEKATLYIPGDNDLQANLGLVNKQFQDKVDRGEVQVLPVIYQWATQLLSLSGILWFGIVLLSLGTLMLVSYKINGGRRIQVFFPLYAALLLLFFVLYGPRLRYFSHSNRALVFADRVDVKSGPDDQLATLFILHQGAKVTVLQKSGAWLSIQLDKNYSGWVPKTVVKVI